MATVIRAARVLVGGAQFTGLFDNENFLHGGTLSGGSRTGVHVLLLVLFGKIVYN